jgi:peptide/nickel transport system substrate-binding protein
MGGFVILSVRKTGEGQRSRGWRRTRYAGLALTLATLLVAATGGISSASSKASAVSGIKRGGTLTMVGVNLTWPTLNPINPNQAIAVMPLIYDSLFYQNPKGQVVPQLATGYTWAKGGSSITIALRKGVKFTDGTPFNASAAVYNLDQQMSLSNDTECSSYMTVVSSITATGPYSVRVNFNTPFAPFISLLSKTFFCGMMASPTALQSEGASFGVNPVGAGAFHVTADSPGSSLTLSANPHYYIKGEPYLSKVVVESVGSDQLALEALQTGQAQVFWNGVVPPDIAQAKSEGLAVQSAPGITVDHVQFVVTTAPFNNPTAREAVVLATDPKVLDQALYASKYQVAQTFLGPGAPMEWNGPKVKGYPSYNLAKAQALVKSLGGLSFTLTCNNTPAQITECEAEAAEWQQAGMNVNINPVNTTTIVNDFQHHTYQAIVNAGGFGPDPDLTMNRLFNCNSALNSQNYCNQSVNALLNRAAETFSTPQRHALYEQATQSLDTDYVWAALWVQTPYEIQTKNVQGMTWAATPVYTLGQVWLK